MTSYLGNVIPFGPVPNASKLTGRGGPPPVSEAAPDSAGDQHEPGHQNPDPEQDSADLVEAADQPLADNDDASQDAPSIADAKSIVEGVCAQDSLDLSALPAPNLRMLLQPRSVRAERFNPLESPEKSIQITLETIYSRFTTDVTGRHSALR